MDKLLSICIPTYKRAANIKVQMERLCRLDKKIMDKCEILISDNCSPDNTKEVVDSFKNKFEFNYNRNAENLGFDGNFLYIYTHAVGKYIWILGDDDYILPDRLESLLICLESGDYGLVHIDTRTKCHDSKSMVYYHKEKFIEDVGIWITFITANIINRNSIGCFDYNKYYGTCFLQVPQNLMAMIKNDMNLMYYQQLIDDVPSGNKNGGYNIFQVFVTNYIEIFMDFYKSKLISKSLLNKEIKISEQFILPFAFRILLKKEITGWNSEGAWKILNTNYGYFHIHFRMLLFSLMQIIMTLRSRFKSKYLHI